MITELWEDHNNDGIFDVEDDNETDSCVVDNTVSFLSGGEFIFNTGEIKCDPDEESTESGIWTLSEDDLILTLFDNTDTTTLVLLSITPHRMELQEMEDGRIEGLVVLEK